MLVRGGPPLLRPWQSALVGFTLGLPGCRLTIGVPFSVRRVSERDLLIGSFKQRGMFGVGGGLFLTVFVRVAGGDRTKNREVTLLPGCCSSSACCSLQTGVARAAPVALCKQRGPRTSCPESCVFVGALGGHACASSLTDANAPLER